MEQKLVIYYRMPGSLTTERNQLTFAPDPSRTAVIARECIHLHKECNKNKCIAWLISVNDEIVINCDPNKLLNIRAAELAKN